MNSIEKKQVGQRLKNKRIEKGMTLEEVAQFVGAYSRSTVGNWERGNTLPKPHFLEKFSKLFNVPIDWIKYGDFKDYIFKILIEACGGKVDEYGFFDKIENYNITPFQKVVVSFWERQAFKQIDINDIQKYKEIIEHFNTLDGDGYDGSYDYSDDILEFIASVFSQYRYSTTYDYNFQKDLKIKITIPNYSNEFALYLKKQGIGYNKDEIIKQAIKVINNDFIPLEQIKTPPTTKNKQLNTLDLIQLIVETDTELNNTEKDKLSNTIKKLKSKRKNNDK